jgi:hypothetical protein
MYAAISVRCHVGSAWCLGQPELHEETLFFPEAFTHKIEQACDHFGNLATVSCFDHLRDFRGKPVRFFLSASGSLRHSHPLSSPPGARWPRLLATYNSLAATHPILFNARSGLSVPSISVAAVPWLKSNRRGVMSIRGTYIGRAREWSGYRIRWLRALVGTGNVQRLQEGVLHTSRR